MAYKQNNYRRNFLNTSLNYSEVNQFKKEVLKPILQSCNESNKKSLSKANVFDKDKYLVPNNNNKYYLLVCNKSNSNNKYKTLYFFPEEFKENTRSDFFMEIDNNVNLPKKTYLFEGYMYNQNNTSSKKYMITDVLYIENRPIENKYSLRLNIFREIVINANLKDINNSLTISIHPIFKINEAEDEQLYTILRNNFIYKKEICSKEYVYDYNKENYVQDDYKDSELKNISTTKYIDVYNVHNVDTNDSEGILYISSINVSKKMIQIFKEKETESVKIKCRMNKKFKKWEPEFN